MAGIPPGAPPAGSGSNMIPRKYRLKDGSIYWHKLYFAIMPEWTTRYSPPFGDYNYAAYLYQPHKYIIALYDEVKWFIQRGRRGYSDRDVWSIDWYITSWMLQALEQLKRDTHGHPIGMSKHSWDTRLDLMVNAFRIARKIQDCDYKTPEEYNLALKQFRRGFNLFKTHFFSLWD
jgi:hypothetical protein